MMHNVIFAKTSKILYQNDLISVLISSNEDKIELMISPKANKNESLIGYFRYYITLQEYGDLLYAVSWYHLSTMPIYCGSTYDEIIKNLKSEQYLSMNEEEWLKVENIIKSFGDSHKDMQEYKKINKTNFAFSDENGIYSEKAINDLSEYSEWLTDFFKKLEEASLSD